MHNEVSETENIRKNLAIERMITEGCDILLDVTQVFVRQGMSFPDRFIMFQNLVYILSKHVPQSKLIVSCSFVI